MRPLELPEIRATSPTLAETMRACLLRAGLSRTTGIASFVLGNPRAWLGTAYHEVLEGIAVIDAGQGCLEQVVDRLWREAIGAQQRRADGHALDRRFGPATTWPGYHIARASVQLRAAELVAGQPSVAAPGAKAVSGPTPAGAIREQEFTACGGKLLGRPDVIRAGEVVDYKSGAILEHDGATQTDIVKASYVRQLRIYGYLVKQKLGWWPQRGVLFPLGGAGVEIALEPAECEREAAEAVSLLDEYNGKLHERRPPDDFAAPSAVACKWCPFKLICPPFWRAVSPSWSGQLDGAAIQGELPEPVHTVHGGAALAISVEVRAGTEPAGRAQITPLNPLVHTAAANLVVGDAVRLVGLRVRPDGQLVPILRTLLTRVADLPAIETRSQACP